MKNIKRSIFVFIVFFVLSCTDNEDVKRYRQLRKDVLSHYKANNNPLKEKAARFLLDNLKDQYAIDGERYKVYSDTIKKYFANKDTLQQKLVSVNKGKYTDSIVIDINVLTAEYLIDNIDRTFVSLEKAGWKDEISFTDFCEYVLPYRSGNEPLENWRKEILRDSVFKIAGDTLFSFKGLKAAADYFTRKHSNLKKNFLISSGESVAKIPDLSYSVLDLLSTGTCENLSQLSIFACRSVAIPVAIDFTPHWANRTLGHNWVVLITKNGTIPFILPIKDTLGVYKTNDCTHSKIYRHTFSNNPESHVKQRGFCDFLPYVFNDPRLIDVTDTYLKTMDFSIPVLFHSSDSKYAYLAVSDRLSWVPVDWGIVRKKQANFKKIGENCVYLPVSISGSGITPFNYPFVLNSDGEIRYFIPDLKELQRVELARKYPIFNNIRRYINSMKGGKFQADNNKSFRNAITLDSIVNAPDDYYNKVHVNLKKEYRFVRYIAKDMSRCTVSELAFYDKSNSEPLLGEVIGTQGTKPLENAFDGDLLTYIDAGGGKNQWIGLDMGKPRNISKIVYAPRTDKNHVIPGHLYELFYWDNEWKSLGEKIVTDKTLVYDSVPSNSLLFLKNHTEGREERIFTYENGEQVWW